MHAEAMPSGLPCFGFVHGGSSLHRPSTHCLSACSQTWCTYIDSCYKCFFNTKACKFPLNILVLNMLNIWPLVQCSWKTIKHHNGKRDLLEDRPDIFKILCWIFFSYYNISINGPVHVNLALNAPASRKCSSEPALFAYTVYEQWHEISNNVVCATSKGSDQPAHTHRLIRACASRLNILWLLSYWPNKIWSL